MVFCYVLKISLREKSCFFKFSFTFIFFRFFPFSNFFLFFLLFHLIFTEFILIICYNSLHWISSFVILNNWCVGAGNVLNDKMKFLVRKLIVRIPTSLIFWLFLQSIKYVRLNQTHSMDTKKLKYRYFKKNLHHCLQTANSLDRKYKWEGDFLEKTNKTKPVVDV